VLAADSQYRVTQSDTLRMQLAESRTDYPDALASFLDQPNGSFDGHAITAAYNHTDRNWSWSANYEEYSPEFRADSGFINQVGVRYGRAQAQRRIRGGPDKWFRNLYLSVGVDDTRQYEGHWNEWGADIGATYEGPRQSEIGINLAPNQEYFDGVTYHNHRASIYGLIQASPDVALGLEVRGGEAIDYNNSQAADTLTVSPSADLNIGRRFRGELRYDYQVFDDKQGQRIFTVHLPQARLLWHFNSRAFVRTILQYQHVDFVTSKDQELLTQFLFSYRINAQTVFLAGYSDDYQGDDDLTRTERAVFVKVGYAFLF
jgi:hypothetical protein